MKITKIVAASPLLCGLIVLAGLSPVARADSFYSTQASWAAALSGGTTTVNFEGIAPPDGFVVEGVGPGANTTVGGINFAVGAAGLDNIFFILGDGYYGYPVSTISLQPQTLTDPADLVITPPSAVTALGFDFGSIFDPGTAVITLSDGSIQIVTSPSAPDFAFFGVIAPGGITSVEIAVPDTFGLQLADFSYPTPASTTPEPSSFMLFGSGLLGFAGLVRRKLALRT